MKRARPNLALVSVLIEPASRALPRPVPPTAVPFEVSDRGYGVVYRPGETAPRCPGCGLSSWLVGRTMVECAKCATALPIAPNGSAQ